MKCAPENAASVLTVVKRMNCFHLQEFEFLSLICIRQRSIHFLENIQFNLWQTFPRSLSTSSHFVLSIRQTHIYPNSKQFQRKISTGIKRKTMSTFRYDEFNQSSSQNSPNSPNVYPTPSLSLAANTGLHSVAMFVIKSGDISVMVVLSSVISASVMLSSL